MFDAVSLLYQVNFKVRKIMLSHHKIFICYAKNFFSVVDTNLPSGLRRMGTDGERNEGCDFE